MARFGAPTLAWETRFDYPHLWGTRRIGPDLSRTAGTRSADWHFAHLFAPRSIVSQSVMPAYPALFDGAADRPRQEARDLLAYLESLGRARELAGPEGEAHAREACNCADDEMLQMAFDGTGERAPGEDPAARRRAGAARRQPTSPAANSCTAITAPAATAPPAPATALARRRSGRDPPTWSNTSTASAASPRRCGTACPARPCRRGATIRSTTSRRWRHACARSPPAREEPALPAHLAEIGARVYAANCAQCHGADGDGRGSAADALPMAPTNFRAQRPTLNHSLQALRNGVDGTPMAPWSGRLGADEMLAVAHHVRGLYDGGTPMITDLIVGASLVFTAAFVAAWWLRPSLRRLDRAAQAPVPRGRAAL